MKYLFILLTFFLNLFGSENFTPKVTLENSNKIVVEIGIADGIHLNRDGLQFSLNVSDEVAQLGKYSLPRGEKDSFGGEIYSGKFRLEIPLILRKEVDNLVFTLQYQGCSDKGICFRPEKVDFTLIGGGSEKQETSGETNSIVAKMEQGDFFATLITFFGFGLLLSLTPCIFPLIPILSSIIVAQGEGLSAKRGFFLSLVYTISMAFAYAITGVVSALFGANIQIAMQNPIVVTIFALIFVALALSLFGFYEIKLPTSIQNRLMKKSDEAGQKGGFIGVAIMGFLSALIVGPCVAPPLAGAILYISQSGDALLGGLALFFMGFGTGVPLLLIGAGAGKFMPKPGGWMEKVSQIFGIVMLGIAIQTLSKILPDTIVVLLWGILFISSSIYLGALEPLKNRFRLEPLFKSVAVMGLIFGAVLFVNSVEKLIGFEKATSSTTTEQSSLSFQDISTLDELDEKLFQSDRIVMVDFTAKWCVSCKEWEEITFRDKEVQKVLENFELYRVDVSDNSEEDKAIMKELGIVGPPAILFFQFGVELEDKRIYGFKNPKQFIDHLKSIKEEK